MHLHHAEELVETIRRQTRAFTELVALLSLEHQALLANDADALNSCAVRRGPLLASIEELDGHMAGCVKTHRIEPTRSGIERFLAQLPPAPRQVALSDFAALRDIAQRCRDQNEVNGKVIAQNQRTAQRLMRALRGAAADSAETYSASGQADTQGPSSTFATV
jgi:flagella synthesis protein FlgN